MTTRYKVINEFVGYDKKKYEIGNIGIIPDNIYGSLWLGSYEIPLQFDGNDYIIGVNEKNLQLIEGEPFEVSI